MSRGTFTRPGCVLCAGMTRRTLSEKPDGDVWKPWKWMFVGSSSSLRKRSRIVSPGRSRIVGPMKEPS